jgi:AcrR family transcriptional regulator
MPVDDRRPTRQRIVTAAMQLFGERGYAATTIKDIETAVGLSKGAGGIYRHFPSKEALLAEGVRQRLGAGDDLLKFIDDPAALAALPRRERLVVLARAGIRRVRHERDLNRLLVRGLADFPDLLEEARDGEFQHVYLVVALWLEGQVEPGMPEQDWQALASVLIAAITYYWLLCDVFGEHPAGIDEDRYVEALATLVGGLLEADEHRDVGEAES